MRNPMVGDWERLFGLLNRCFRPQGERMERCFPHFLCEENAAHLWLEAVDGEVVGHVGYLPETWAMPHMTWKVGRIGAVCTEEAHRGGGVGTRLLMAAMEGARAEGIDLFVISGDRGLYTRQGSERCGSVERFVLEALMLQGYKREGVVLRPYHAEDLGRWMQMNAQRSVHWGRSAEEWSVLMGGEIIPWMREAVHRAYSVCVGEEIVASLVLWERPTHTEVIEWAGEPVWIMAGLAAYAALERSVFPLRWSIPWHEQEIAALLHRQGAKAERKEAEGVICVLGWCGLMERIQQAFRQIIGEEAATVRLEEEGEVFSMVWEDARLRWQGRGNLARLLFGEPAFAEGGGTDVLPMPVFEGVGAWGRWEEVKRLLPFPRPLYGLSYI